MSILHYAYTVLYLNRVNALVILFLVRVVRQPYYVSGKLDMNDATNNTIVWSVNGQELKQQKQPDQWSADDPNLECVFIYWEGGTSVLNLRTFACDISARYVCFSKRKC